MEDESVDSIFKLITSLCEKFHNQSHEVRTSRTKCYEILLGKRLPKQKKDFRDLKGTNDPVCNLLSWQFILAHDYNLKQHAFDLQECTSRVQDCYASNIEGFNNILQFLLSLRNLPSKNEKLLDLSSLPPIDGLENFNKMFKLPPALAEEYKNFDQNIFNSKSFKCPHEKPSCDTVALLGEASNDEGYFSPPKSPDINIWELVSKLKYSNRRNWENYRYPEPDKERPFLSELGDLSSLWVENLESVYRVKLYRSTMMFNSKLVPRVALIRDLKYLLVGMASESFNLYENGEFYLLPGITVEGITPDTLNLYCQNFVYCGTCCKALNRMSTANPETGKYKYEGYIFKEFCESIDRYLKFYRTAIFTIPDAINYLQFDEKTHQLQLQISTLASICKVGPYATCESVPQGVALLNYLYQKVLTLTEQKLVMVLYSILYSCCQVYFSRFLKQWVLEGLIDDPYGEFFIKPNSKFISSRGRTYWTRSYNLQDDMVPDFIVDLRKDVLSCGKSMNLLKYCHHSSKLCLYLMGKKQPIMSCCLTLDQLAALRHTTTNYYLDVCSECGPRFKMSHHLIKSQEDPELTRLIAKKRHATLKRLELERQKVLEEEKERKNEEIGILREQYVTAMEQKQLRIAREIQSEMKRAEEQSEIELKRERLVQEEANNMIKYYSELFELADNKRAKIENLIKKIKSIHLDQNVTDREKEQPTVTEVSNSSNESFYSVYDEESAKADEPKATKIDEVAEDNPVMHSSGSMDVINANATEETSDKNANVNLQQAMDNFRAARKNKLKVMRDELGIEYTQGVKTKPEVTPDVTYLTEAQRNKLKILSSEFGIELKPQDIKVNRISNAALKNRNKVMGISDCFEIFGLDNERFLNRNVEERTGAIKKSKSLTLNFDRVHPKTEPEKPIPMSVDSTPISDLAQSLATTPSTMFMSVDTNQMESIPNTAETQQTDEGFNFNQKTALPVYFTCKKTETVFSKRVTKQEAAGVSTNCLKLFLYESIQIPLLTQTKLVNDELLKFFVDELGYLKHLAWLRDYFFLQDGEFGRNITDNLFARLYDANFPIELINCRTLQDVVFGALDMSGKSQDGTSCLSFKINNLPKCFDLGNPDVLRCLSLTYNVQWPLNVLLPTNTINKYDEVFKFLLKLNRMSWVLKKIFLELKVLAKETGKKEIYLMSSPQYRKLHQCRHIMTHFIQTLQNYVVGEVLQSSWEIFQRNLSHVTNLDEIYDAHTSYIKNILFMCLLNQKTAALQNVIHKIFVVILKFFDYLRSRSWRCEEGSYVHPNFRKLESIFENFQELVRYLFKAGRKVAKSGCQPHLFQLLDMLDINGYISNLVNRSSSSS